MEKRGSLELSVNAIVIFIIAFAMLGVGLFFINKVRNSIDIDPGSFIPANQMKNPPSSDDPLTIDMEVKMKRNDNKKITIGYYPKDSDYTSLNFYITDCVDSKTNDKITMVLTDDGSGSITVDPTTTSIACYISDGTTLCDNQPDAGWKLPTLSPIQSTGLKQGQAVGLPKVLAGNNALKANTDYVCTLTVTDSSNVVIPPTKSFYLSVLS